MMRMRQALVEAIDYIRASSEDAKLLTAARVLERKAERLAGIEQARLEPCNWCDCGERKQADQWFCTECFKIMPTGLVIGYHVGDRRSMRRAWLQMTEIAASRSREEAA